MKSNENPNVEPWMYCGIGLIGLFVVAYFALTILVGVLFAAYLLGSLGKRTQTEIVRTTILAVMWFVLTAAIVGIGVRFQGLLFSDFRPMTETVVMAITDFVGTFLPKKWQVESVNPQRLRFYLWLVWPIAVAFSSVSAVKKFEPTTLFFDFATWVNRPLRTIAKKPPALITVALAIGLLGLFLKTFVLMLTLLLIVGFEATYDSIHAFVVKTLGYQPSSAIESVIIGKNSASRKPVGLDLKQLNHHVHIVGASGFGKSVLLTHLIRNKVATGSGLMFIDLKADIETIQDIKEAAKRAGRPQDLQIFSCANPDLSANYNVLKHGTANQITDRLITGFQWSEEFYKNRCQDALQTILSGMVFLKERDKKVFDLFDLYEKISQPALVQELSVAVGNKTEEANYLHKLLFDLYQDLKQPNNLAHLSGLKTQIGLLIHSDFGKLFRKDEAGIDLFDSIDNQKIVYVLLDSRRYGESSKALGKIILEDLKSTSSRIDNEIKPPLRKQFSVIIDEFADMATDGFIGFLDRARSSKIGIVVAHQEVADLERLDKSFRVRLMNSTSTLFAFLQKDPDSSELIARMAGTKTTTAETERSESGFFGDTMTGQKSVRVTEEYIIHPNDIKTLQVGECVLIEKYPKSDARKIKIDLPEPFGTSEEIVNQKATEAAKKSVQTRSELVTRAELQSPID